jgi:hypothetical protein
LLLPNGTLTLHPSRIRLPNSFGTLYVKVSANGNGNITSANSGIFLSYYSNCEDSYFACNLQNVSILTYAQKRGMGLSVKTWLIAETEYHKHTKIPYKREE